MKNRCKRFENFFWRTFLGKVTTKWGDRITTGINIAKEMLR